KALLALSNGLRPKLRRRLEDFTKEDYLRNRAPSASGASPLRHAFTATQDGRKRSQRFIHSIRIREHVHQLRIEHDDVRPLSIASCGDTADTLRKIVLRAHGVPIGFFNPFTHGLLHSRGARVW